MRITVSKESLSERIRVLRLAQSDISVAALNNSYEWPMLMDKYKIIQERVNYFKALYRQLTGLEFI